MAVTAVVVLAAASVLAACDGSTATAPTTSSSTPPMPATAVSSPTTPAESVSPAPASSAPASAQPTPDTAAAYCTGHGGTVESRQPYLNTNLERSQWVQLPGSLDLCRFESDDADHSRIYIDTLSLASPMPTLAAAAYLAELPLPNDVGGANPATVNCAETVDGAAGWGTSTNGGGWVNLDDPVFTVVDLCVFSDRSAIDQWGIAYYAGGVTRGADLATIFPFAPTAASAIFPPADD